MSFRFLVLPGQTICVVVLALALAVAFGACIKGSDGLSDPVAPTSFGPQFAIGAQDQLDITVTSDKELYDVGETAHFTVAIYKNGELWEGDNTAVDATFPDESIPVPLTSVSLGVYSYDATLTSEGQKTLTVSTTHNYASAVAAMLAKIASLEGEISDLENQLAGETDPKKQTLLQTKIDNRVSMIDKFEDKIANMEEPMGIGLTTITVELQAPAVTPEWINCRNGVTSRWTALQSDTLGEAKLAVAASLGIPPSEVHLYDVSFDPCGIPLDETKTLAELGITQDGITLFVCLTF